jgi:hypothetical protein
MTEKIEKAAVTFAGVRIVASVAPDGALLIRVGSVRKPKEGKPLQPGDDGLVPLRVIIAGPDGQPAQRLRGRLHQAAGLPPPPRKDNGDSTMEDKRPEG